MDADRLNLRHLRAALAVARAGTVGAAAREIHLTQPAITQGLAKLEAAIGARLFDRRSDGMAPTAAAHALAPRIEAALALVGDPRVTAAQLRAFLALARAGSYRGAAAATGISEASLHRAVGDLGAATGQALVERRGNGVALTARGRQAARRYSLARAELSAGLDEVAALLGRETGRIAVGAMPLARARLLPSAIAAMHRRHPGFSIAVAEGSHQELVGPLRDGEVDVLVGALRTPAPDLVQSPLLEDRPVVLARAGHPAIGGPTDLPALARYPWTVAARGAPLRDHWERMFADAGLPTPPVPVECGSVITIRQLLLESDFLTLLSPTQVAVELEAGWLQVVRPAPPAIMRVIGTTVRAGWTPTPLQRAFLAELRAAAPADS